LSRLRDFPDQKQRASQVVCRFPSTCRGWHKPRQESDGEPETSCIAIGIWVG
jgi:hypothetical protein